MSDLQKAIETRSSSGDELKEFRSWVKRCVKTCELVGSLEEAATGSQEFNTIDVEQCYGDWSLHSKSVANVEYDDGAALAVDSVVVVPGWRKSLTFGNKHVERAVFSVFTSDSFMEYGQEHIEFSHHSTYDRPADALGAARGLVAAQRISEHEMAKDINDIAEDMADGS